MKHAWLRCCCCSCLSNSKLKHAVLTIINVLTRPISDWTRETARVRGSICHNTKTNFITLPQMIPTNSVCKWADWNRATAMGWGLSPRHQNKVYNCAANDSTKLCKCVGYIRLKRRPDRGRGCQWIGLSVSARFYNCAANNSETRAPIESWWCEKSNSL
jgi:hypothetical protein